MCVILFMSFICAHYMCILLRCCCVVFVLFLRNVNVFMLVVLYLWRLCAVPIVLLCVSMYVYYVCILFPNHKQAPLSGSYYHEGHTRGWTHGCV